MPQQLQQRRHIQTRSLANGVSDLQPTSRDEVQAMEPQLARLVYPVPDPSVAGLGIHLTIDLAGQAKFGPDVQWVDDPNDCSVDPSREADFVQAIRRYWPGLPDGALAPAYAGVRPKISGAADAAVDFRIDGPGMHGIPGLVNLFGIESPGLTCCLALGEHVADLYV